MNSSTISRTMKAVMLFVAFTTLALAFDPCSNQWSTISLGDNQFLALMKNGELLGWEKSRHIPAPIKEGAKWVQVVTKFYSSFGILSDGTLWAMGSNKYGQLGDGTTEDKKLPVQIGTDKDWVMVAAGLHHNLAIKKDGSLWIWGKGDKGQLGMKVQGNLLLKPTRILSGHIWVKVFAGLDRSFAITKDGALWAWGDNDHGQLGDGTKENAREKPLNIAPGIKWGEISVGPTHTLGLDNHGNLYAWGSNWAGQFGDGTKSSQKEHQLIPKRIGTQTWISIQAAQRYSTGITADGSLFTWGTNAWGQLGDGSETDKYTPVHIGKEFSWKQVAAGFDHMTAITHEGYRLGWGLDKYTEGHWGTERRVLKPTIVNLEGKVCFGGKSVDKCPGDHSPISGVCLKNADLKAKASRMLSIVKKSMNGLRSLLLSSL